MHDMNRSLHLLATGNASALSSGRSHIVIERKDPCRIRGLPYDLCTLRVVLLNHLPVIEKLEIRTCIDITVYHSVVVKWRTGPIRTAPFEAVDCVIDGTQTLRREPEADGE